MKNTAPIFSRQLIAALALTASFLALPQGARAASATWISNYSGSWSTGADWSTGITPGTGSFTGSTDTASFTSSSIGNPIIAVTGTTNIGGMDFSSSSTTPNSYVFSGGTLALSSGALINEESNYIGSAAFNSVVSLAGTATFTANEAFGGSLTFGAVTTLPSTTATLTLNGSNSSYFNEIGGAVTPGASGSLSITKAGSGLWVLGTNQSSAALTLNNLTLDGGTLVMGVLNSPSIGSITVAANSTLRLGSTTFTDVSSKITLNDTDTLTLDTNGQSYTWASSLGVGTNKTGGLTKTGAGTLNLAVSSGTLQSYTGATTVLAGLLNITDTFTSNTVSNPISSSSSLVLGGGEVEVTGTTSTVITQTFNGTTLNAGVSEFNSGSGTATVNLGAITRNSGALLNIVAGAHTSYLTSSSNDANGVLNGVVYSGSFTTVSGGTITGLVGTTQNNTGSWTSSATNYATNNTLTGGSTASGTVTIGSLFLNGGAVQNVTIANTLAVTDGLGFGSSIGAHAATISGGTLTSAGGDLIIFNNDNQNVYGDNTVNSVIGDSGTGTHTNVILSSLQGALFISGNNTYTGNTYVGNGSTGTGTVTIGGAAGAQIGSANATVYVNGGNTLRVGNADGTGNILGTVEVDNGTFSLDQSSTSTLTANVTGVTGAGVISMDGTDATTINFTGTNTFYGLKSTSSGTLTLAGATSNNTFINANMFNAANTASSTTVFQGGTYIFQAPGNATTNQIGTWTVNGANANVYLLSGRYLPSVGANTFNVSAGSLNFAGDRWSPGDSQNAGSSLTFNVSGTGTMNIAPGTLTLGSSSGQTGATQNSTSSVTVNQTGGVVNIAVAPGQGQGDSASNTLSIGNGYSEVQAQYNLGGGTLRVAGIQGVAPTAVATTATATLGSNTITLASGTNVLVGQVLTGNSDFAAGTTVTSVVGSGTVTVSNNATAGGAVATSTFTQPAANLYRVFNWTSGTLTSGSVSMTNLAGQDASNAATVGTLFQGGGTLAPGDVFNTATFTGKTSITGNYQLDGGYDLFTLGGSTAATAFHSANTNYDNVAVTGTAKLNGGGIEVGFVNSEGGNITNTNTTFNILTAGTVTGTYSNLNAVNRGITLDRSLTYQVTYGTGTVSLGSWKDPAIIALSSSAPSYVHVGTGSLSYTLNNAASGGTLPLPSDNLYYTLGGSASGTGTLAPTASLNGSLAETFAAGANTYTVSATDPNALVQGDGTNTLSSATITLAVTGYTGQGTWTATGGGSWGTISGTGTQSFGQNWATAGGSPGLDPNYQTTDSAYFGTSIGSSAATVSLDGASPYLKSVTFSDASGSYNIAPGSGGTLHLDSTGTATISDLAGNHTISAPVEFDAPVAESVAASSTLTVSGNISQTGTQSLALAGPGTTILSGSNSYTGTTSINGGVLSITGSLASPVVVGGSTASGTPILNGTGSIAGNIIVASASGGAAGTITPGTGGTPGTLTVGNITFQTGSDFLDNISGSTAGVLAIGGTLVINPGADFSVNGTLTASSYLVATDANGFAGTGSFTLTGITGYSLVASGDNLYLEQAAAAPTTGTYTLTEAVGSSVLHIGASTTATTTLANTGSSTADNLDYSGLGASAGTGSISGATASGGPLTQGASAVTTQTYTATTAGNDTVTGTGSVTGDNGTGTATLAGSTSASVFVYTGQGTWTGSGSGTWGSVESTAPTNWAAGGGIPGISGASFQTTDSALFASSIGTGSATVSLNGSSPYLNNITFANTTVNPGSYTIAQGTGGTIHLDSTGTATIANNDGNNTISAPIEFDAPVAATVASSDTLTISGNITQSGTQGFTLNGPGATVLSGNNTYTGPTTVASGSLFVSNTGSTTSATGSGTFALNPGATLGGTGYIHASSFALGAASSPTATVIVGNGTDTISQLTITGTSNTSTPNTIKNVTLAFNLSNSTLGQSNELNVGSSAISFTNTTLALNIPGVGIIPQDTPYVLIAGTAPGQYVNLSTTSEVINGQTYAVIQNLGLTFSGGPSSSWYGANSVLFLNTSSGVDDIEVLVVPEPSTWAMMIGGLAMLIFWQRRRGKN